MSLISHKKLYIIIAAVVVFVAGLVFFLKTSNTNNTPKKGQRLYMISCPYSIENCDKAVLLKKSFEGYNYSALGVTNTATASPTYAAISGKLDMSYDRKTNISTVKVVNSQMNLEAIYYAPGDVRARFGDKKSVSKGEYMFFTRSNEKKFDGTFTLLFLLLNTKNGKYISFSKNLGENFLTAY